MIDREKLERAIEFPRVGVRRMEDHEMCTRISTEQLDLLIEAAREHLATLPKVTTVTRWSLRWAEWDSEEWVPEEESFDHESVARSEAGVKAAHPNHHTCIEVVSFEQKVPVV